MNKSERDILVQFKKCRNHVVGETCADLDCKKEYKESLLKLMALCTQAEAQNIRNKKNGLLANRKKKSSRFG